MLRGSFKGKFDSWDSQKSYGAMSSHLIKVDINHYELWLSRHLGWRVRGGIRWLKDNWGQLQKNSELCSARVASLEKVYETPRWLPCSTAVILMNQFWHNDSKLHLHFLFYFSKYFPPVKWVALLLLSPFYRGESWEVVIWQLWYHY